MIPLGSKDTDVTKYRHVLVEFDHIPTLEEQWNLICEAKLPCTAVISSGNKSLHAWVRVDAKNLDEYAQRRKLLFDHIDAALRLHGLPDAGGVQQHQEADSTYRVPESGVSRASVHEGRTEDNR